MASRRLAICSDFVYCPQSSAQDAQVENHQSKVGGHAHLSFTPRGIEMLQQSYECPQLCHIYVEKTDYITY